MLVVALIASKESKVCSKCILSLEFSKKKFKDILSCYGSCDYTGIRDYMWNIQFEKLWNSYFSTKPWVSTKTMCFMC